MMITEITFLEFNYDLFAILSINTLSNRKVTTFCKKVIHDNPLGDLKTVPLEYHHCLSNLIISFFFHEVYML